MSTIAAIASTTNPVVSPPTSVFTGLLGCGAWARSVDVNGLAAA